MHIAMIASLAMGLSVPQPPMAVPVGGGGARAAMPPFEDWAEANDINAPKLALTGSADLRGVLVLEDVDVGEELCCVPRTSCLDLSSVEGAGSPCEDMVPSPLWVTLRWYERLACWLLAEQRRGESSPVSGYMGYLPGPAQFAQAPLAWTDEELAQLSYPPVAAGIREQAADLERLHDSLLRAGGALARDVSLDELRWANQLVLSRAFTSTIATPAEVRARAPPPPPAPPSPMAVTARMWFGSLPVIGGMVNEKPPPPPPPALGDGLDMAMMPMLDAFNHRSGASNTCSYDGVRNSFVLTANAPLTRGTQAFISYGDKSNDELLQLFGFVEESNPHDVFLSIGLAEYLQAPSSGLFMSPEAAASRFAVLESLGLDSQLLGELSASSVPPGTMQALRVLLGTAEELQDPKRLAERASLQTEERAWAALRGYCKMARAAMGGPRKADEQAAKAARRNGGYKGARQALALEFRSEKKRLLSELESRLTLVAGRSRKAGKPVKL